ILFGCRANRLAVQGDSVVFEIHPMVGALDGFSVYADAARSNPTTSFRPGTNSGFRECAFQGLQSPRRSPGRFSYFCHLIIKISGIHLIFWLEIGHNNTQGALQGAGPESYSDPGGAATDNVARAPGTSARTRNEPAGDYTRRRNLDPRRCDS